MPRKRRKHLQAESTSRKVPLIKKEADRSASETAGIRSRRKTGLFLHYGQMPRMFFASATRWTAIA